MPQRAERLKLTPFVGPTSLASARTRVCNHMSESTFNSTPSTSAAASGSATGFGRPGGSARVVLRWLGRVALALVAVLFVGAASIYGLSERRFQARFAIPEHRIAVSQDSASIVRGEHMATVRGCVDCHGAGLSGNTVIDQPIIGRLAGPNLTLGGRGAELTPRDWERAVRHGVRRDGKPLLFMPATEFTTLTDEDLASVIAYARSVPNVKQPAPSSYAGPLLRTMYVAGKVDLLSAETVKHARPHEKRLVAEPTAI